jgi:hypothetical protein
MKVNLITVTLALCLASGAAIAQQSPSPVSGMGGSNLVRPCAAVSATSDCAIGLGSRLNGRFGSGSTLTSPSNNLMNQAGSGLGSTFSRSSAAGPLGASGDTLSRGISGGTVGRGIDPLGIDSNALLRSMSSGSHSMSGGSLGGLSAAGPLGRETSGLGFGSGSRLR